MKKLFVIVFIGFFLFDISAQTKQLFVEDSTLYNCKVISINKLGYSFYGIRVSTVIENDTVFHYIVSSQSNRHPQGKKIRKGNMYSMQLSRYHEKSDNQTSTKFIQPILIGEKIIKVIYDFSFPWVIVTPNLDGLYYISSSEIQHLNIEKGSLDAFIVEFLNNISVLHCEKTFNQMTDTTLLRHSFEQQYPKSDQRCLNLSDFAFDSLFLSKKSSGIDTIMAILNYESAIVLIRNNIINIRIKWEVSNEKYPRSAMLVIRKQKDGMKVIGLSAIPLPYFSNEFHQ